MTLTVSLVSRNNGVGLTTDMTLLEDLFRQAGHRVVRVPWTRHRMRPCDVAVFLELYSPALARFATSTVGVFNLEWFPQRWEPHLPSLTQLWAKSREAYDWYRARGLRPVLTGFAGRDLHRPDIPRETRCLHLRGHSGLKGTGQVLEAWRRHHRILPPLTVVSAVPLPATPGVTVLGRIPHDDLIAHANTCRIHLCPSLSEGWGHYITEALSVGAVVVTADASPMSEHVRPAWGYLLPVVDGPLHHMVPEHRVDPDDIAAAVTAAAELPARSITRMGRAAREHFTRRNRLFAESATALLGRLDR